MQCCLIMNCSSWTFKTKTAAFQPVREHFRECSNIFNPPLHTYVDIEAYSHKIADNAITFEAWENNILIGLIAAYFNDLKNKAGFITNVSVLPEYQGKGIAKKLLVSTLEYGKLLGFGKMRLEVNGDNTTALNLYLCNGFSLIEKKETKLIMERALDNE